jgi:CRP/FNR family transcriptional regulator
MTQFLTEAGALERLLGQARRSILPAGSVLFRPGDLCAQFLLLRSGAVRVFRVAASGREMALYRVRAGETCVMTTACLLASEAYAASGVVEEEAEALLLPAAQFEKLMAESAGFRALVFHNYAVRILDLMRRIEALCDVPVRARLAAEILGRGAAAGVARVTHQALADEIGTAREVVSRQLAAMEAAGLVRLARGRVEIGDVAGLRALAGG